MNYQQGFSLTEVLISLMLVSTTALALLQQQRVANQILLENIKHTDSMLAKISQVESSVKPSL